MIDNPIEFQVVVRNLGILERTLCSLRKQLEPTNPHLLEIASKAYVRRIALLREDITAYLAEYGCDTPLIVSSVELVNRPEAS